MRAHHIVPFIIVLLLLEPVTSEAKTNIADSNSWFVSVGTGKYGAGLRKTSEIAAYFAPTIRRYVHYDVQGIYNLSIRKNITFFDMEGSVGLTASYEKCSGTWNKYYFLPNTNLQKDYDLNLVGMSGTFESQVFSLATELTLTYCTSKNGLFRMYGALTGGVGYRNEVDTYNDYYFSTFFNGVSDFGNEQQLANNRFTLKFHLMPIAFSVGRKLRLYSEFGFGYKGLVNVGVTSRL